MKTKKMFSIVLCLVILFGAFGADSVVFAVRNITGLNVDRKEEYQTPYLLEEYVDAQEFSEYILQEGIKGEEYIEISQFNIPVTQAKHIRDFIVNRLPEIYYFLGTGTYNFTLITNEDETIIEKIKPYYKMTLEEYTAIYEACEAVAENLLYGIKDNPALGDVEKALLVRDRLITYCEYDQGNNATGKVLESSSRFYGPLLYRCAVCSGYSDAYSYLLNKVGIKNYHVGLQKMAHEVNIVYIDGEPYFVDSTWDDYHMSGRADHENFLHSNERFKKAHADLKDFEGFPVQSTYSAAYINDVPTNTQYDDNYWINCHSAFQLIDDYIYYIKQNKTNGTQLLYRSPSSSIADDSDDDLLYTFSGEWRYTEKSTRLANSALCSDGKNLFFNSPDDNIYKYNVKTGEVKVFYTPVIENEYDHIYGFIYDGHTLGTEINSTPQFNAVTRSACYEEVTYIDPETCGMGDHLPEAKTEAIEATCENPDGMTAKIVCHACGEVLQEAQEVHHEQEIDHVEFIAPEVGRDGLLKKFCKCGAETDEVIPSLACRDFDCDGEITAADYSNMVNAALKGLKDEKSLFEYDINGDGCLDVLDVVMFERSTHSVSSKLDTSFSVSLFNIGENDESAIRELCLLVDALSGCDELIIDNKMIENLDYEKAYRIAEYLCLKGVNAQVDYKGINKNSA